MLTHEHEHANVHDEKTKGKKNKDWRISDRTIFYFLIVVELI